MRTTVATVFIAVLTGCGGAAADPVLHPSRPADPEPSSARAPVDRSPEEEALATVQTIVEAMRERDLATLRSHADPEFGTWFWAAPGLDPVPCTWLDPMGDADPFVPAAQSCTDLYLLDHLAPTLHASLDDMEVDRGEYVVPSGDVIDQAAPWGSFDTQADLSRLRELADTARASRSVRAAIDGQPIVHTYRAEVGRRSVTLYLTERFESAFLGHVVADVHDVWTEPTD